MISSLPEEAFRRSYVTAPKGASRLPVREILFPAAEGRQNSPLPHGIIFPYQLTGRGQDVRIFPP